MKVKYTLLLLLAVILISTGCGSKKPNELNWKVGEFKAVDQEGKPFEVSQLKGKVWMADFIFTSCTTVCPGMTLGFAKLQQKMKDAGVEAELVSFSVDPEVDKPEALKDYVSRFNGDLSNWRLLTGYSANEIKTFSQDSFKTMVQNDPNSDQVTHGTSYFLVDQTGTVVASYDSSEPPYDKMIKDMKALLK